MYLLSIYLSKLSVVPMGLRWWKTRTTQNSSKRIYQDNNSCFKGSPFSIEYVVGWVENCCMSYNRTVVTVPRPA